MNIQYHFQNISDALKDDLKSYGDTRFEHLETFLGSFQDDNKLLRVDITHHDKHDAYEVKCNLEVGGKTIHHKEVTHNPKEAIDKSEANLIRQAKKHIQLLRENVHLEHEDSSSPEEEAIKEMEDFNK